MLALAPTLACGGDVLDSLLLLMQRRADVTPDFPTEGLVAYYTFESSLDSVYGEAQTLTNNIAGTVAQFGTGISGEGLVWTATNKPIFISTFAPTTYPYSVAGWVKWELTDPPDTISDTPFGINKASSGTTYLFADAAFPDAANTNIYFRALHRATNQRVAQDTAVRFGPGEWIHVAVTSASRTNVSLWVNGTRLATTITDAGAGLTDQAAASLRMVIGGGTIAQALASRWTGTIDETFFYNTLLTTNQVQTLYGLHN